MVSVTAQFRFFDEVYELSQEGVSVVKGSGSFRSWLADIVERHDHRDANPTELLKRIEEETGEEIKLVERTTEQYDPDNADFVPGMGFVSKGDGFGIEEKFDPDQPRYPRGHPSGGQWKPSGGDGESRSRELPQDISGMESLDLHTDENGNLTEERKRLHDEIVEEYLSKGTPQESPRAWMMGGGTASGKSAMLSSMDSLPNDLVIVDSDDIKQHHIPEYAELKHRGDSRAAFFTHEESSLLSKRILNESAESRRNVFLDGTGDGEVEKLRKKITKLHEGGYEIVANYITVDTEVALERERARAELTGRTVPESIIRNTHKMVSVTFPAAIDQGLFDRATLWDNNLPGKGENIRRVADYEDGKLTIHEPELWGNFLRKADEEI